MSVFELEGKDYYPATNSGYMGVVMFKRDGDLYYYHSHDAGIFNFSDDGIIVSNLPLYRYNGSDWEFLRYQYDDFKWDEIVIQTYRSGYPHYYSLDDASSGRVPYTYTSHAFGSMQTTSVLGDVVFLLPALLVALVFYIGIRKAIAWLFGLGRKS